ncbi:MAG TPA: DUF1501 domain-containing protein, partial [Pirellulaceae bacterium]|nr:DUF1501 domain-containing protein [Pirellulaceae bacterium]
MIRSIPREVLDQGRRTFIREAFCGFGGLALAAMAGISGGMGRGGGAIGRGVAGGGGLASAAADEPSGRASALSPRLPPRPAKAKNVIFLFMAGGPSHVDTFDPKPLLNKLDGEVRPAEFGEAKYQ